MIFNICQPRSLPNIFVKDSRYRRVKCYEVLTGLLAFVKDVGCHKHPLSFARPAKQRYINKDSVTKFLKHFSLLFVNANTLP